MHGVGILSAIIIGLLAGWIASMIVNRHHGLIVNLIIGLIGGLIGGWLAGLAGFGDYMGFLGSLIASILGAVVLLFLLGLFRRPAR